MDKRKRIEWIDIAKGIGIISVVIGHTYLPYLYSLIYLFISYASFLYTVRNLRL